MASPVFGPQPVTIDDVLLGRQPAEYFDPVVAAHQMENRLPEIPVPQAGWWPNRAERSAHERMVTNRKAALIEDMMRLRNQALAAEGSYARQLGLQNARLDAGRAPMIEALSREVPTPFADPVAEAERNLNDYILQYGSAFENTGRVGGMKAEADVADTISQTRARDLDTDLGAANYGLRVNAEKAELEEKIRRGRVANNLLSDPVYVGALEQAELGKLQRDALLGKEAEARIALDTTTAQGRQLSNYEDVITSGPRIESTVAESQQKTAEAKLALARLRDPAQVELMNNAERARLEQIVLDAELKGYQVDDASRFGSIPQTFFNRETGQAGNIMNIPGTPGYTDFDPKTREQIRVPATPATSIAVPLDLSGFGNTYPTIPQTSQPAATMPQQARQTGQPTSQQMEAEIDAAFEMYRGQENNPEVMRYLQGILQEYKEATGRDYVRR